jgi:hypothetical protein
MDMVHSETEVAKLEAESFQVMERLDADINVDLLSKAIISVVGDKHHRHPVIAGITRNLFRATATYKIHNFLFSCRTVTGQVHTYRVRQKTHMI